MGWFDSPTDKAIARIEQKVDRLTRQLSELKILLNQIVAQEIKIMEDLNKILDQAEANAQKEQDGELAIEGLINALAKQVADLKNTAPQIPKATLDRIQALSDGMAARAAAMASKALEGTEHA